MYAGYGFSKLADRSPIIIPEPNKVEAVMVSQDLPLLFFPMYEYSLNLDDWRRDWLFAIGIPQGLAYRLCALWREWDEDPITPNLERFFDLYKRTYWTHYHKCPTDNANKFGNHWAREYLREELIKAEHHGCRVIIPVLRHVQRFVERVKKDGPLSIKVAYLSHPSGKVRSWDKGARNPNGKIAIEIKNNIETILDPDME